MKITFPNKTAKRIVDECENKTAKGNLLYSITWYENQDFYTTEKCRPGEREISLGIVGYGKDWNECKALVEKEGGEMMNFAEFIWFVKCHVEQFGKYPLEGEYKWSWTSSRSSDGRLVVVGYCASDGVSVGCDRPDYSDVLLGVVFMKMFDNAYPPPTKVDTLEQSISKVLEIC